MSSQRVGARTGSFALSYDAMEGEEERVEDDGEEWEHGRKHHVGNSALFLSTSQEVEPVMDGRGHEVMTPVSPEFPLGEGDKN